MLLKFRREVMAEYLTLGLQVIASAANGCLTRSSKGHLFKEGFPLRSK